MKIGQNLTKLSTNNIVGVIDSESITGFRLEQKLMTLNEITALPSVLG